jgi:flagellar hook-length control protein FliK
VRFVQRVVRAFEAAGDRGGTVRLRLHPRELGSLRLEATIRNGVMNARLEVETASARSMLLENLTVLRERLAEQDVKVGRFDVELTDRSAGGSSERTGDHPQSHDRPRDDTPRRGADPEPEPQGAAPPPGATPVNEENRLDVII